MLQRKREVEEYWRRYNSDSFLGSVDEESNRFLDEQLIEEDENE